MSKPSQAPVEPPPSSLPPHVQKAVDSNQPAPERFETVPVASFKSIRASGKNEAWLQQQIFDDPSILGLGDLQGIRRERAQTSGGRLDMLLVNPSNDDMFEVEIMLGECDESHIIRTIEYWDSEKRRWPQRKHTAVLVAERINGRFYNVIHLLSQSVPIIGIQCNLIEIAGQSGLQFTRIIDTYEEPEVDLPEESSPFDESQWAEKHPEQRDLAKQLEALAREHFEEVELRFGNQYMAIKAGRYDRIKMWARKKGHTLVSYRLEPDRMEEAIAEFSQVGIEPSQKSKDELQFTSNVKSFQKHRGLHAKLMQWFHKRDLQFKLAHTSKVS